MIVALVAVVLQTQSTCVSKPAAQVVQRWAAAAARAHAIACEKLAPNIPGFAIAVAVDGRIVWSEAFGYADLEAQRAAARAPPSAGEKRPPTIQGCGMGVAGEGGLVWSEASGYAALEARRGATPATRSRMESVSNPLTATAIAQLFEIGTLDLDAPVQ